MKRVLVITGDHHLPDPTKRDGRFNEEDFVTHDAMMTAFRSMQGFAFTFCSSHERLLEDVCTSSPDLVVNFCDTGFRNDSAMELHVPAYLELLGIRYTGAPPAAMVICYDKALVRAAARGLGVPVPNELFFPAQMPLDDLPPFELPALVKPNAADGSVGITADAVVHDREQALAYLGRLRETLPGRDALIQEYLPGAEYGIGLIGNPDQGLTALPALEVDFSGLPAGLNPILSFESKAIPDSPYWTEIRFRRAVLDEPVEARLVDDARRLFRRLSLRDYARFDFRTGADGVIKLMEVNPNPAWANDAKLAFMASFAGMDYPAMLAAILSAAIRRLDW